VHPGQEKKVILGYFLLGGGDLEVGVVHFVYLVVTRQQVNTCGPHYLWVLLPIRSFIIIMGLFHPVIHGTVMGRFLPREPPRSGSSG